MSNILYVASEIAPYASTGGLADVAGSLPPALLHSGHLVRSIMPMYRQVLEGGFDLRDTGLRFNIPVGFRSFKAEIWSTTVNGLETFFVRRDEFFDRSNLYNLPGRDYDDNFERFVFFQKAVVAFIDAVESKPDIVHGNDWQAGLLPLFLSYGINGLGRKRLEKFVFTIHNLAYQGLFSGNDFPVTNLPFSCFDVETMEFYGNINCLKNGITCADRVTTVSETYAREIQSEEQGYGLQGVMTSARPKLRGIVNGIDTKVWNPSADPHLKHSFSAVSLAGKKDCRRDLLDRFGLDASPATPVVAMVSRLVDQKGLDLLEQSISEILGLDLVFVLLGRGDEKYERLAESWRARWPSTFGLQVGFDIAAGHQIIAGSDILLMPSKAEPCGLNQLYALRYGTVPLVHEVGGLADTIHDIDIHGPLGNGFTFRNYVTTDLLSSLRRALTLFGRPDEWNRMQLRGMAEDNSWLKSARLYGEVYKDATA